MKKILSIILGFLLIGTGLFADDYAYDYIQMIGTYARWDIKYIQIILQ